MQYISYTNQHRSTRDAFCINATFEYSKQFYTGTGQMYRLTRSVTFRLWNADDLSFRRFSSVATTVWYFQPTSCDSRLRAQYLRLGFRRRTRRADGTTSLFCLSYGGGIPSKTLRRSSASLPRVSLCGSIPVQMHIMYIIN